MARAAKWGRAGVPVPRPLAQEARVADPPPRVQDLRHTRRCGPALPHGPPTPEALRLPQHWKNRPQSPPREAPRGPNCLRCRRVGVLFSRLAPPSPFRLRSKELPRCPLAGGSCRSPRSQRGPLYPCGRQAVRHKAPPPQGSRGHGRRRSLSAPSQWGAEGDKGWNSAGGAGTPRLL